MSDARHYAEELQDLLDGRLAEPLRSEVAAHVETCGRCRRELDALRWVKSEVPKHVEEEELPADLSSRVRASLDAEDRRLRWTSATRLAWIAGVGAVAAGALLFVFLRGHTFTPLPAQVAGDFTAYNSGAERLEIRSGDPKAVEAYFARNGVAFPTHVYDLGMMQYRLLGGRVNRLDNRMSALFAYRGSDNTALVCQMYQGRVSELPTAAEVREHNGFTFHVYRSGNVTLVFWQEGDVVCVLASDAPTESVVQLAFAKAMRLNSPGGE